MWLQIGWETVHTDGGQAVPEWSKNLVAHPSAWDRIISVQLLDMQTKNKENKNNVRQYEENTPRLLTS